MSHTIVMGWLGGHNGSRNRGRRRKARHDAERKRRSSSPLRSAPSSNGTISISTVRWRPSSARPSSAQYPEATRNIFALLAFAAGFLVRPFGALVFGRIGDLVGRKYTFLVTIMIMGLSTFLVGLLPGAATIGIAAPVILIALRMLQGLALGGEYGGAATYVAEHAPDDRRGYYTSWIQTTATLGLFLSLIVILIVQGSMSKEAFAAWGWRIPFLLSFILLGISVWIRLSLERIAGLPAHEGRGQGLQGAADAKPSASGRTPRSRCSRCSASPPARPSSGIRGQFYALFFLQNVLKVDAQSVNIMIAIALALGTRLLRGLRLAVRQDRPQADHHGRPARSRSSPISRCSRR